MVGTAIIVGGLVLVGAAWNVVMLMILAALVSDAVDWGASARRGLAHRRADARTARRAAPPAGAPGRAPASSPAARAG